MTKTLTLVPPQRPLRGAVAPPGSKSITNRALLLAALSNGTSHLTGALKSDDTRHMANALRGMGVAIEEPDATSFVVHGAGGLKAPSEPVFLGNAGTATRFLTAAAALANGVVVVTGDEHMQKRPIAPLVAALGQLGIVATAPSGCPPVTIDGRGGFEGDSVTVDAGLSSQYISALLMLAAGGSRPVQVNLKGEAIGARGYIDLTCAAMRHFGARVEERSATTWVVQPGGYRAVDMHIEPDASAATYLWAAEVLTGGDIDIGTAASAFTQPDARAHALINQFPNLPRVIEGSQMQDAVPTLAVLAAFCREPVRFTGIANLRVKECDRVAALANELARLAPGSAVEEGDDLLVTPMPAERFRAAEIETYADHRIAMSLALAGLMVPGVTIKDPDCVNKTYPAYWRDLRSLGVAMSINGE
ncbi:MULTISPECIES: 3-phosphoshikimate 1-carboxyvinyltransferase [unclassified Chelatococcus]|uniref:3-phosphoshikimate 1-carboxyvinyltransferase n=1 Tax=unclassified Chelatococcus TaxID=2638111 RepID=UPI001BCDE845|nr:MULTISPECIES: 3-phosphoshikimate 1-carboxyvinyltransferase [unclassified Chelatococcus]MBS7696512.1 3-phosphoshikimate 1-carboxyvinyltransferase [Chelatococcus sp. YT9]MBX3555078.1 3-phosphoshikimate 1-carboxyvinyltransferase [Chelatococcus sp.]